jgi:hypothetical protein
VARLEGDRGTAVARKADPYLLVGDGALAGWEQAALDEAAVLPGQVADIVGCG